MTWLLLIQTWNYFKTLSSLAGAQHLEAVKILLNSSGHREISSTRAFGDAFRIPN